MLATALTPVAQRESIRWAIALGLCISRAQQLADHLQRAHRTKRDAKVWRKS